MNVKLTKLITISGYGGTKNATVEQTLSGDGEILRDIVVPGQEDDFPVDISVDVSNAKLIWLLPDKNLSLKTNVVEDSSDSESDELDLVAGKPVVWTEDEGQAKNPFQNDITRFYFTNTGEQDAKVHILVLQDATPEG